MKNIKGINEMGMVHETATAWKEGEKEASMQRFADWLVSKGYVIVEQTEEERMLMDQS